MAIPGEVGRGGVSVTTECSEYSVCLTKLDILDNFDEVKVGVAYKIDGNPVEGMPGM